MIMAVTGIVLVGFIIGHMIGNLKLFAGCEVGGMCALDHYAIVLHEIGKDFVGKETVLWLVRIGLLLAVALHVDSAVKLTLRNKSASPQKYAVAHHGASTYASRSMALGGLLLLSFIVIHLLHFTTGTLHFSGFVEGRVHANVTSSFQHLGWVVLYCIAMIALGMHLFHGVWSMFQTLGLDSPKFNKTIRTGATLLAVLVSLGFLSVPLAVFAGFVAAP